ncbi:MAG: slipin family protein [Phycisphaerae bacterium]
MSITVRIKLHERGLWFRHGDFRRILAPGKYRFWTRLFSKRDQVEVMSTLEPRLIHPLLDVIVAHADAERALLVVALGDGERALVWKDDRLACVLGPGRHAFWRTAHRLHVEKFVAGAGRFEHPQRDALLTLPGVAPYFEMIDVGANEEALVYRDGVLVEVLREGRYVYWKTGSKLSHRKLDRREQLCDINGQDVMTSDKVTLRINLLVGWQIADALTAVNAVGDVGQAVYREAQLVLRGVIGVRTLDALLADKDSVGRELRDGLARRAAEFGVALRSIGLRDVILPGDMKELFNQVIAAEKQAQANLIKRREETAAIRNQANTARLLAENPALARLKELEVIQDVLGNAKATFVLGPGDLMGQFGSLIRKEVQQNC